MKHVLQNSKIALFVGLSIIVIGASAWQIQTDSSQTNEDHQQACADTARPGTVYLNKVDLGIKTDSILKAAQIALSAVDFNKMQQEIKVSMDAIDFDEINKSIETSLKSIEWDKMKIDVNIALDEAKAEIAKVNKEEIKKSLEKAKAELKSEQLKHKIDMTDIQKEVAEGMENAKKEIERAKLEIANYRAFISALESDGLIKAGESYKVELRNNLLYINGVQQSKETTEKYRKYYRGKTHFTIYDNKDKGSKEEEGEEL